MQNIITSAGKINTTITTENITVLCVLHVVGLPGLCQGVLLQPPSTKQDWRFQTCRTYKYFNITDINHRMSAN